MIGTLFNKLLPGKGVMGSDLMPRGPSALWRMGLGNVEDDSTGPAYYINNAGERVTIPAESPLYAFAKFWSIGGWTQMCADPYDPSQWTHNGAVITATGISIGDFIEYSIKGTGQYYHRAYIYESSISGNPTGVQYFAIAYNIGTSGQAHVVCRDSTAALYSIIIKSGGVWGAPTTDAGQFEIVYEYQCPCGFTIALFTIDWINKSNSLTIGIGPNSYDTVSDIKVYACSYINELGHIWPFTGPGSTTIASRAGTTSAPLTAGTKPYTLLDGESFKLKFDWTPSFNRDDVLTQDLSILSVDGTIYSLFYLNSGSFKTHDKSSTALMTILFTRFTSYEVEILCGTNNPNYIGVNKKQIKVREKGASTWVSSAVVDFDGSFNPNTELIFGYNNDYPQNISPLVFDNVLPGDWE